MARVLRLVMVAGVVAAGLLACARSAPKGGAPSETVLPAPPRPEEELAAVVFGGGFKDGWQDTGWSPRKTDGPESASVHFANSGGWILAKPGLAHVTYGALVFRVKPPKGEAEFLEVRVESPTLTTFPRIKLGPQYKVDAGDGWYDVRIPMFDLDPEEAPFDRIVFRAFRSIDDEVTLIDAVGFTKNDPAAAAAARLNPATYAASGKPVSLHVECTAKAIKISPLIYGIAYYPITDQSAAQWKMGAVSRRWGGNTSSRYNWEHSVWNLDSDWFFENKPTPSYETFLATNEAHGVSSALTVPLLGWVSKDGASVSFPVSLMGPQGKVDPYNPEAGDGTSVDGKKLTPGPPTRTSQPAPPDFVKRWVEAIHARDVRAKKRSVVEYILDNEPMLWSTTHRDVRTEPLGYDELLERTIDYGTAVRQADPDAVIAGPAEWGWTGYLYSAKDSASGVMLRPDRRAHDDKPLVEWYLEKLRQHEEKTGVRILDVLDLHFYPQAPNVYGGNGGTDTKTASLRLRSTRALWDPSYVDESWIKEPVRLLPRMKEWVDKNYPGRGISIGEWNFGGEGHITGALAIAEALGRFAQFGVTSAYYWTHPADDAPALEGFLAYRNFDGKGGHFLGEYLPSAAAEGVSLFASRDEGGRQMVIVAINMSADAAALASIELQGCGPLASHQSYTYLRGAHGFIVGAPAGESLPSVNLVLPPWSLTVLDVRLAKPLPGSVEK